MFRLGDSHSITNGHTNAESDSVAVCVPIRCPIKLADHATNTDANSCTDKGTQHVAIGCPLRVANDQSYHHANTVSNDCTNAPAEHVAVGGIIRARITSATDYDLVAEPI